MRLDFCSSGTGCFDIQFPLSPLSADLDIQFRHLKGPRIGPKVKLPSIFLQKNLDNVDDQRQT